MPELEKDAPKAEETKPASKLGGLGGKVVPLVLVVNSVLLAGVLGLLVLRPLGAKAQGDDAAHTDKGEKLEKGAKGEKGKDAKDAPPGPMMRLPDFVVHLRDADADRYVRVAFEVEVADEKAKEGITVRMPMIRDAFLSYLSDRTADELRGSEAMARLKGALAQRLADIAPNAPTRGLYVADLVVQ